MYVFDLKAECGRTRVGVDESAADLMVSVVGNPVRDAVNATDGDLMNLRLCSILCGSTL